MTDPLRLDGRRAVQQRSCRRYCSLHCRRPICRNTLDALVLLCGDIFITTRFLFLSIVYARCRRQQMLNRLPSNQYDDDVHVFCHTFL